MAVWALTLQECNVADVILFLTALTGKAVGF